MIPGSGFFKGFDAADGEFVFGNGLIDDADPTTMEGLHIAKFCQSTYGAADGVTGAAIEFRQLIL